MLHCFFHNHFSFNHKSMVRLWIMYWWVWILHLKVIAKKSLSSSLSLSLTTSASVVASVNLPQRTWISVWVDASRCLIKVSLNLIPNVSPSPSSMWAASAVAGRGHLCRVGRVGCETLWEPFQAFDKEHHNYWVTFPLLRLGPEHGTDLFSPSQSSCGSPLSGLWVWHSSTGMLSDQYKDKWWNILSDLANIFRPNWSHLYIWN